MLYSRITTDQRLHTVTNHDLAFDDIDDGVNMLPMRSYPYTNIHVGLISIIF